MSLKELISRASVANVTAAIILIGSVVYAVWTRDVEMLKYLAPFAAGYLFGRAAQREGGTA
jgi:hypothetical protein